MILLKCCTQHASKSGKLSSGQRTGKVQFSFQSQKKWKWSRSDVSDSLRPRGLWPIGSSIHGILQARILEWVAISFSRGSPRPRDQTQVSRIAGRCFKLWATREAQSEKKGMPKNVQTTTTIALISHASKVILKILPSKIQQYVNQRLPDVQPGFRKGRGTDFKLPTSLGS